MIVNAPNATEPKWYLKVIFSEVFSSDVDDTSGLLYVQYHVAHVLARVIFNTADMKNDVHRKTMMLKV